MYKIPAAMPLMAVLILNGSALAAPQVQSIVAPSPAPTVATAPRVPAGTPLVTPLVSPSASTMPASTMARETALPGTTGITGTAAPELVAAADTSGGYGGVVLQRVLPHWNPQPGMNGFARILVRVSAQGRVLSCEAQRSASSLPVPASTPSSEPIPGTSATVSALAPPPPPIDPQERQLADMACRAVAAAGEFETPPYGLIAEVSLVLSAGNVRAQTAAAPVDYPNLVLQRALPHIVLPPRLGREFTVTVALKVRGDGSIETIGITRPSGNKDVDAAILKAFATPGVTPPPPGGQPRDLQLTYTLQN